MDRDIGDNVEYSEHKRIDEKACRSRRRRRQRLQLIAWDIESGSEFLTIPNTLNFIATRCRWLAHCGKAIEYHI